MRKIYFLSGVCFMIAVTVNAQLKQKQFGGTSELNPNVTHEDASRGGTVIWSEDFNGGIPADWGVSTTTGPVNWKHTMVGHTGDYPTAPLGSTTSNNGWMVADSDGDNFSGGGAEDTRLISSRIDLTGFTNVKLEFQQMFRRWQTDITTVQISIDSVNWNNFVINGAITQAGTPNPDYVNIDISSIAGNQATVWVAFWWQGSWDYGWQIDDVAIKEILDNDIMMKNERFGTFVEYYQVPSNQIQAFEFSSDVENIGMLTQSNIVLDVTVNDGSTNVYTGSSSALSSLSPWTTDSIGLSSGYTPTGIGTYTVTFEMNQSETDEAPSNNTRIKTMTVTDTVYALDNGIYQGQWYNQETGGVSNEFFIGGFYDIISSDVASSISVFIGDNTDVGTVFEVVLYEFDGAGGWIQINASDLYTIASGDLDNWVTVQLLSGENLMAGNTYMAAAHHFGGPDFLWIGFSSNVNPGYTGSADDGVNFANQPRNPMIRLNLGSAVGIDENEKLNAKVYPNPVRENLTISLTENDSNTLAELIDVTGKVVYSVTMNSSLYTMDITSFAKGMYTLKLSNEKGTKVTQVVIAE